MSLNLRGGFEMGLQNSSFQRNERIGQRGKAFRAKARNIQGKR
jgi:hypothetical protein